MGRKRRTLVLLAVAAGSAVAVVAALAGRGGTEREVAWQELPAVPLSPREAPVVFWTGEEVVVVGGSDAPPCPPNASCLAPSTPPLADGAAYDVEAGTWRPIAPAPVPFSDEQVVVVGRTAYVWSDGLDGRPGAESAFLAYRIDADRWEELELPTRTRYSHTLVVAGDRIVAHTYADDPGEVPDYVFDPDSSSWTELPDDPFSPGFDRVMIWNGEELLLFDHELVPNPGGDDEPLPLRGAALALPGGEWRTLADPEAELRRSGWAVEGDEDVAGAVTATGAHYRGRSGRVHDATADEWLRMPELEPLATAHGGTTETTAGRDLFVFLGTTWPDGFAEGELHAEAWLWSPGR